MDSIAVSEQSRAVDLPIYTVSVNPAWDLTYRLPEFQLGKSHRVEDILSRPGGKGLNVARVLDQLGEKTAVTGFLGGERGKSISNLLAVISARIKQNWIETSVSTRQSITVVVGSEATVLNEAGETPPAKSWQELADLLHSAIKPGQVVALCGSFPGKANKSDLALLIKSIKTAGGKTLLDTSGELLISGAELQVDLLKPNSTELAEALGENDPLNNINGEVSPASEEEALSQVAVLARKLLERGAGAVTVSLGSRGLLAVSPTNSYWAKPVRNIAGNPTGAGDAAVAALCLALRISPARNDTEFNTISWLADALPNAVALSGAAVLAPVAGEVRLDAYKKMLSEIKVKEIPCH